LITEISFTWPKELIGFRFEKRNTDNIVANVALLLQLLCVTLFVW